MGHVAHVALRISCKPIACVLCCIRRLFVKKYDLDSKLLDHTNAICPGDQKRAPYSMSNFANFNAFVYKASLAQLHAVGIHEAAISGINTTPHNRMIPHLLSRDLTESVNQRSVWIHRNKSIRFTPTYASGLSEL